MYATAKGVEEVFVHGDSLKEYLVGIVVPNKGFCEKWAKEKGFDE